MSKKEKIKELIQKRLKEISATGTGASFNSGPSGENYPTPVAGKAKNYYYKMGFEPVKQLQEETESKFDIESFISSLNTEDEELKNYIAGRLGDFDLLANRIKELISLIQEAKKETINSYRENPEFKAIYGTDLAIKTIDNAIKLFT